MAIPSQSPRPGMMRRGMSSRRKGLGKWPKVLLLLVGLAFVAAFFWPPSETPPASPSVPEDTPPLNIASTDALIPSAPAEPPPVLPEPAPPAAEVVQAVREVANAVPPPEPLGSNADARTLYDRGDRLIAAGDLVAGRAALSRLLFADHLRLSAADARAVRQRLDEVNQTLFWSPDIAENDPLARRHLVQSGELLGRIGVAYRVPYPLLEKINRIKASRLQADRPIKVIQGPLHARVIKHQFLMDLYAHDAAGAPVYVCSFPVGLGENDKTPLGNWQVVAGSKVTNPDWRDELNGDYFAANDPDNPIGEYWIKIRGLDPSNKDKVGFGIHGTIDPDSIGAEASRGCIRLGDQDIELVFSMLTDHSQGSTVQILP